MLIASGSDVAKWGGAALCETEDTAVARLLLDNNADPNYSEGALLQHALWVKNINLVRLLLESGAKIEAEHLHKVYDRQSAELLIGASTISSTYASQLIANYRRDPAKLTCPLDLMQSRGGKWLGGMWKF